jgi:hypothetical protein
MLQISQHLREVGRPVPQELGIGHGHTQHFRGDDRRKGLGKIPDDVHPPASFVQNFIDQLFGDFLDVDPQQLNAPRRKGRRRQAA